MYDAGLRQPSCRTSTSITSLSKYPNQTLIYFKPNQSLPPPHAVPFSASPFGDADNGTVPGDKTQGLITGKSPQDQGTEGAKTWDREEVTYSQCIDPMNNHTFFFFRCQSRNSAAAQPSPPSSSSRPILATPQRLMSEELSAGHQSILVRNLNPPITNKIQRSTVCSNNNNTHAQHTPGVKLCTTHNNTYIQFIQFHVLHNAHKRIMINTILFMCISLLIGVTYYSCKYGWLLVLIFQAITDGWYGASLRLHELSCKVSLIFDVSALYYAVAGDKMSNGDSNNLLHGCKLSLCIVGTSLVDSPLDLPSNLLEFVILQVSYVSNLGRDNLTLGETGRIRIHTLIHDDEY